ncbi:MAG: hypothetical protein HXY40_12355 [Chloroflexi bacterium]|nr:hypothetical protein [Chloroflexota bacterium]
MSNGTAYSDEEINLLAHGPMIVMMATTESDGVTPMGLLKESAAVAGFMSKAHDTYHDNLLVLLVIDGQDKIDKTLLENRTYDELLAMVDDLSAMLKDDAESGGYRRFLLEVAEHTANAAGEGLFGSGVRISAQEADFLNYLKQRLGLV